jgi:hypothetical protein
LEIPLLKFREADDIECPHPAVIMLIRKCEKFFMSTKDSAVVPAVARAAKGFTTRTEPARDYTRDPPAHGRKAGGSAFG